MAKVSSKSSGDPSERTSGRRRICTRDLLRSNHVWQELNAEKSRKFTTIHLLTRVPARSFGASEQRLSLRGRADDRSVIRKWLSPDAIMEADSDLADSPFPQCGPVVLAIGGVSGTAFFASAGMDRRHRLRSARLWPARASERPRSCPRTTPR